MKDIKKPDLIGSYVGQTTPKVYKELVQGLGKVVFIDEAYSIAGPKDNNTGKYNEYGQEALDAITDYTSEHIGLFAFVVAGYEYEMRNQFLSVNIGLPRRFPTVLTLNRYNLNSYWLIFKSFISKYFLTELVKTQHRACFELLNLMFNYQCQPNPQIELSQNWKELWQDSNNNITNLRIKLKINENVSIPLLQLANFNNKINDSDYTVTSNDVEVLPYTTFFGNNNVNIVTTTFIKAFIMFHFTQILNGDFFRTQADTLNKFQFIMTIYLKKMIGNIIGLNIHILNYFSQKIQI